MALKRKIEKESKNSGTDCKASKVQVREIKKKPFTKNEILLQFQALEVKHANLVQENERNVQEIARLQKQKSPTLSKDQECQTKAEGESSQTTLSVCVTDGVEMRRN